MESLPVGKNLRPDKSLDFTKHQTMKSSQGLPYDRSLLNILFDDACYFIIKSNNYENVLISKQRGVWSTPITNEKKLNEAFSKHKNVILIFSIKESGRFAGFARLLHQSIELEKPIPWILSSKVDPKKLRNTFRLAWINKNDLFFSDCANLINPWNENKEVKIARDGQPVEPTIGKKLCLMFPPDPLSESCFIEFVFSLTNRAKKEQKESTSDNYEQNVNKYSNPTDIYCSFDRGRYLVEAILNKSYAEYIQAVKALRNQMNLKAIGITDINEMTPFETLDVNEFSNQLLKYYNS